MRFARASMWKPALMISRVRCRKLASANQKGGVGGEKKRVCYREDTPHTPCCGCGCVLHDLHRAVSWRRSCAAQITARVQIRKGEETSGRSSVEILLPCGTRPYREPTKCHLHYFEARYSVEPGRTENPHVPLACIRQVDHRACITSKAFCAVELGRTKNPRVTYLLFCGTHKLVALWNPAVPGTHTCHLHYFESCCLGGTRPYREPT